MFQGREFEIFDEPGPDAAQAFGDESAPPAPDPGLNDQQNPGESREGYGDPSRARRWARRTVAVASLASAAAAAALLLPLRVDHGDGSPVARHGKRAVLAGTGGRVQRAPSAGASSSRS